MLFQVTTRLFSISRLSHLCSASSLLTACVAFTAFTIPAVPPATAPAALTPPAINGINVSKVLSCFAFWHSFPELCFSGLNYCFGRFVWLRALGCWRSSYVRVPRLDFGGFCAFLLLRVLACVTSLRNLHCNLLCMQVPVCSLGTSAQSCCTSAWSTFAVEKEGLSSCQTTKKEKRWLGGDYSWRVSGG